MNISEIRTMLTIMDNFADEVPLNLIKDVEVTKEELTHIQNCNSIIRKQKEKLRLKGVAKFSFINENH